MIFTSSSIFCTWSMNTVNLNYSILSFSATHVDIYSNWTTLHAPLSRVIHQNDLLHVVEFRHLLSLPYLVKRKSFLKALIEELLFCVLICLLYNPHSKLQSFPSIWFVFFSWKRQLEPQCSGLLSCSFSIGFLVFGVLRALFQYFMIFSNQTTTTILNGLGPGFATI